MALAKVSVLAGTGEASGKGGRRSALAGGTGAVVLFVVDALSRQVLGCEVFVDDLVAGAQAKCARAGEGLAITVFLTTSMLVEVCGVGLGAFGAGERIYRLGCGGSRVGVATCAEERSDE